MPWIESLNLVIRAWWTSVLICVSVTVIPYLTRKGVYGLALHDEGYKQKLWWTRKLRKEAPSMSQVCELGNAYEEIQRNDLQEQIPLTRLGRSVNTWFG